MWFIQGYIVFCARLLHVHRQIFGNYASIKCLLIFSEEYTYSFFQTQLKSLASRAKKEKQMSETTGNFAAALDKEENGFAIVEGNEYVQHERTPPKSHSCCGCCCDTRRAVVVVNIISMTFAALAIVSLSVVVNGQYAAQFDDDEVQAALEEIDGTAVGITIGLACLGIACNTAGIIGALKFNKFAIVAAGLWYFAEW